MTDATVWAALRPTAVMLTVALNLEMLLGLALALMVSKVSHALRLLRTMMMFPRTFSPLLGGFQFLLIFNDDVGPGDQPLHSLRSLTADPLAG